MEDVPTKYKGAVKIMRWVCGDIYRDILQVNLVQVYRGKKVSKTGKREPEGSSKFYLTIRADRDQRPFHQKRTVESTIDY